MWWFPWEKLYQNAVNFSPGTESTLENMLDVSKAGLELPRILRFPGPTIYFVAEIHRLPVAAVMMLENGCIASCLILRSILMGIRCLRDGPLQEQVLPSFIVPIQIFE